MYEDNMYEVGIVGKEPFIIRCPNYTTSKLLQISYDFLIFTNDKAKDTNYWELRQFAAHHLADYTEDPIKTMNILRNKFNDIMED